MPIKNYTTKIDVFESLGEIQGALARNGARKIMVDYDDRGRPVGITFGLQTAQGGMLFQLPANTPGVMAAFERQKIRPDVEQAERSAELLGNDGAFCEMENRTPGRCMKCQMNFLTAEVPGHYRDMGNCS